MESEHPASMTARAIKQTLPDRTVVTREARTSINTATSMFTLYLSAIAHDISVKNKRSTITLKDVLAALRETEFEHFVAPVEQCILDTKAADARKKARRDALKAGAIGTEEGANAPAPVADHAAADIEEEVPLETDADLDGDRTIDEDDGDDDEEEVTEEQDEEMETQPLSEPLNGTPAAEEDASMEATKDDSH